MSQESNTSQIEFDLFWYDSVNNGVAYFFRWLGEPRSTVLVVWDDNGPTHIECRKRGDTLTTESESMPIIAEVTHLFCSAGFYGDMAGH